MANVDVFERELRLAESGATDTVMRLEAAVSALDGTIATLSVVAGQHRPNAVMEAIAEIQQARQEWVEAAELVGSALSDIRAVLDNPAESEASTSPAAAAPARGSGSTVVELSSADPGHVRRLNRPPANATIVVDGRFRYETDEHGRVVKATATLETIDQEHPRSDHAQKTLSGKLPGDDAGHLFARIFQGPGQKINLSPMEALGVNRGEYKALESHWRGAIEAGRAVEVEVRLSYPDDSARRPAFIRVRHRELDGDGPGREWQRVRIKNTPRK